VRGRKPDGAAPTRGKNSGNIPGIAETLTTFQIAACHCKYVAGLFLKNPGPAGRSRAIGCWQGRAKAPGRAAQKRPIFVPGGNLLSVRVLMPQPDYRRTKGGTTMRSSIFAIPALAILASASFLAGSTPARAADDPVCLEGSGGEGSQCDFETLAQCQATLSGMDGTCEANGTRAMMKTKMAMKDLKFKHTEKAKK
jgi:Protein of unknown function (DUF3551)